MNPTETLNSEKMSSKTENEIEIPGNIRILEVDTAIESGQRMTEAFKITDVNDKTNGSNTKERGENDQLSNVLAQRDEKNLCNSLLTKSKKIIKHKIVLRKNPVKTQKKTKFGSIVKGQKQRSPSLRRNALLLMTRKKNHSLQAERCFKLFYERNKSQIEFQELQNVISGTPDIVNEEAKSGNVTKLPILNKSQFQHISTNRLQEVSTKMPASYSSQSESIISSDATTKSQPQKVKSAKEVWEHFIWFLRANKESFDGTMTDGTGIKNMESSECANHSLKYIAKTSKDSSSQNFEEAFKPKTECVTTEMQDHLNKEIAGTRANSVPFLKMIHQLRCHIIKKIQKCEEFLKKIKLYGQLDKNMMKKIGCLHKAKELQTKLHDYYDVLCDHQRIFTYLKESEMYSVFAENSLSIPTRLTDLPLTEAHIRTFSAFFLYQHKSLYFKVPIENTYKRINSENYVNAYRRYQKRNATQRCKMETSKDAAIKLITGFLVTLEVCRLQMNHEIPHSKNVSLEVYQNCCIDLGIAISENINCLKDLLSVGSSVVFPVVSYLSESRKRTLETLLFLDTWRSNVFPSLK